MISKISLSKPAGVVPCQTLRVKLQTAVCGPFLQPDATPFEKAVNANWSAINIVARSLRRSFPAARDLVVVIDDHQDGSNIVSASEAFGWYPYRCKVMSIEQFTPESTLRRLHSMLSDEQVQCYVRLRAVGTYIVDVTPDRTETWPDWFGGDCDRVISPPEDEFSRVERKALANGEMLHRSIVNDMVLIRVGPGKLAFRASAGKERELAPYVVSFLSSDGSIRRVMLEAHPFFDSLYSEITAFNQQMRKIADELYKKLSLPRAS